MKLAIDIRSLSSPYQTGVACYTRGFLDEFARRDPGHQITLFWNSARAKSPLLREWQQPWMTSRAFHFPNKLLNGSLAIFGRPRLDRLCSNPDIFFSPNLNFTALSKGVRHVLTIHDLSFEFFPDCFTPKQRAWHRAVRPRKQCRRADAILVPSHSTKLDVMEHYGIAPEKIHVVYPGVSLPAGADAAAVRQKYRLPEQYILFFGALEPRKNIEAVIDAFSLAKRNQPRLLSDVTLVLAGAPGWKMDGIKHRLKSASDVAYIGFVPEAEKAGLYAGARAFVYPSLYEGFGFPVIEAFAAGVPVVTSNRSSLPEITNGAAYLVNPRELSDIADGITALLADSTLCRRLIEEGKKRAALFHPEKAAADFFRAVQSS